MPDMVYASTNEALKKIIGIIGEAYALPGADTDILDKLQDLIVVHFQTQAQDMGEIAAGMASSSRPEAGMPGGTIGAPPPAMQIAPGGGSGMSGYGSAPNADELRRVLGGTGATV